MRSLVQYSRRAFFDLNLFLGFWLLSEFWIRRSRPQHTGEAAQSVNGPSRAAILAGVGGGLFLASSLDMAHAGPLIAGRSWALFAIGIGVGLLGIGLRVWAVRTLGRYFQLVLVVQEQHQVVRSGPYRILRHPSYAGAFLTCIGIGLALGRWASLVAMVVLPAAAFIHRISVEERMLVDGLGDTYADYRNGTWRLIPGVW